MNLDLYFQKFEDEIQPNVEEPDTGVQPDAPIGGDAELEDIANL